MVEGREYDVVTGSDTLSAAVLLLVGGFITMIVAVVGIVGAFGMWRPLLFIVSGTHTHTHTHHTHTLGISISILLLSPLNSTLLPLWS